MERLHLLQNESRKKKKNIARVFNGNRWDLLEIIFQSITSIVTWKLYICLTERERKLNNMRLRTQKLLEYNDLTLIIAIVTLEVDISGVAII